MQAPCQHNFCLACFKRWVAQGKKSCPTCRHSFPAKFASNPRINTALTVAIRMAKQGVRKPTAAQQERIRDKDRPDEAFTTDRCMLVLLPASSGLQAVGTDSPHILMGLQSSCRCGAFCALPALSLSGSCHCAAALWLTGAADGQVGCLQPRAEAVGVLMLA